MKIGGRLVPIAVLALAGVLEPGPAAAHERFWAEDLIYTKVRADLGSIFQAIPICA